MRTWPVASIYLNFPYLPRVAALSPTRVAITFRKSHVRTRSFPVAETWSWKVVVVSVSVLIDSAEMLSIVVGVGSAARNPQARANAAAVARRVWISFQDVRQRRVEHYMRML